MPLQGNPQVTHKSDPDIASLEAKAEQGHSGDARISLLTQLTRDIEAAFATMERGAGLTLHETAVFEGTDYCTAEERARVRALELMALEARDAGPTTCATEQDAPIAVAAERAWQSCWFKFSPLH